MGKILIVEDEIIIRQSICRLLSRHGHDVFEAESAEDALAQYTLTHFDLILSDLRLPGASGTTLIEPAAPKPVLVMTSYASLKSAIEAMKLGAAEYIAKPFDHDEMIKLVNQLLQAPPRPKRALSPGPTQQEMPEFIGGSAPMRKLVEKLQWVAPTTTSLVIIGETGTGKAVMAQTAHVLSGRSGPLICVDCSTLQPETAAKQLFGTTTPAEANPRSTSFNTGQIGLIAAADQGTLLFEEIGELNPTIQAMLLRVLETQSITPMDSIHPEQVDIRVIATSQTPLDQLCAEGQLREDLYYRLLGIPLLLPPLFERKGDIQRLAEHFLAHFSQQFNKPGLSLSQKSLELIERYPWPGNVRELRQAIERGCVLTQSSQLEPDHLFTQEPLLLPRHSRKASAETASDTTNAHEEDMSLEEYFQHFVRENEDQMTETELAQKLGISRKTLWERRQKLGIPRKKSNP